MHSSGLHIATYNRDSCIFFHQRFGRLGWGYLENRESWKVKKINFIQWADCKHLDISLSLLGHETTDALNSFLPCNLSWKPWNTARGFTSCISFPSPNGERKVEMEEGFCVGYKVWIAQEPQILTHMQRDSWSTYNFSLTQPKSPAVITTVVDKWDTDLHSSCCSLTHWSKFSDTNLQSSYTPLGNVTVEQDSHTTRLLKRIESKS